MSDYLSLLRMLQALATLRSSNDWGERRLRTAIRGVVCHNLPPEEREWIQRIEALRDQLLSSPAEIQIQDYGAGCSRTQLASHAMESGRVVRRRVGGVCDSTSQHPRSGLLLFKLVRAFKPRVCIELGTSLGLSAAYQAAALELNGAGRLITLEGAPTLATIAQDNFQALQLDHRITSLVGRFRDTLGPLLDEEPHVEYAFVDGHHEEQATRRYFEQIVSAQHEPSVLVFDDINWSPGMRRAWSAIATDPRAHSVLALAHMGICLASPTVDDVLVPKRRPPRLSARAASALRADGRARAPFARRRGAQGARD